jgi:Ion transport protein
MFVEYTDLEYICLGVVSLLTAPMAEGIKKHTVKYIVLQFFLLTLYLILVSHMCACVFLIMEREAIPGDATSSSGAAIFDRYITTLYFLITTSTSVGYGDVTINHKADRLVFIRYAYQVFLMLFSVVINGVFYTLLNSIISTADQNMRKIREEVTLDKSVRPFGGLDDCQIPADSCLSESKRVLQNSYELLQIQLLL